jgi:hypothetical protein
MVKYFRIYVLLAVAAVAATTIQSCTKSDFTGPTLASNDVNNKRTFTINPDEEITLESKFIKPEQLSFEWSMEGQILAKEGTSYRFKSKESGSYIVTQRVYNGIAEVYIDYYITVRGTYDSGTFIFTNNSSESQLTFINKDNTKVDENAYKTANPGKSIGAKISSATAFYGKMYILTESEIIVLNAITLKEINRIATPAKPNYLINVDRSSALLSTDKGVYRVSISPLAITGQVLGLNGRVGMMVKNENYVMALTLNGLAAINKSTLLLTRFINSGKLGLVADIAGNVWTTNEDTIISVSPTLYVTKFKNTNSPHATASWNPWNEGTLTLSTTENALLFIKANDNGTPSQTICKVDISNPRNLGITEFITLPKDRQFTGIGFRINSENNIVASTVNSSGNDPQAVIYRSGDATLVTTVATTATDVKSFLFNKTN